MRKFALLFAGAAMLIPPSLAAAQDTILVDEDDRSVITGTVKDLRFEEMIVTVNGKDIEVDVDDLDIAENMDNFFPVGSTVRIVGELEDGDEMDAREIVRLDPPETTEPAAGTTAVTE